MVRLMWKSNGSLSVSFVAIVLIWVLVNGVNFRTVECYVYNVLKLGTGDIQTKCFFISLSSSSRCFRMQFDDSALERGSFVT